MKYFVSTLILFILGTGLFAQEQSAGYSYSEKPELIDENEMTTEDDYIRKHGYSNEEKNLETVRNEKAKKKRKRTAGIVASAILETAASILIYVLILL